MIKPFLSSLKNKVFGYRYRIVNSGLGGRSLKVYDGTIRPKPDIDDAWFATLAKSSPVIFDIGANIGYTALLANVYAKPKQMVLVDPNPLALASAAGSLIMNNLSQNCRFMSAFVADKNGENVKFFTVGRGAAGSIYPEHARTASLLQSWYWVETITIDEIVKRCNLVPDLIKIDVEGAEGKVLQGSVVTTQLRKTTFFVEVHSNKVLTMEENANKILKWCSAVKYTAWYLKEGSQLINGKQIAHRGRCHLLLIPVENTYPQSLVQIAQGSELPQAYSLN
jgi:FkbM family methyltransferase